MIIALTELPTAIPTTDVVDCARVLFPFLHVRVLHVVVPSPFRVLVLVHVPSPFHVHVPALSFRVHVVHVHVLVHAVLSRNVLVPRYVFLVPDDLDLDLGIDRNRDCDRDIDRNGHDLVYRSRDSLLDGMCVFWSPIVFWNPEIIITHT